MLTALAIILIIGDTPMRTSSKNGRRFNRPTIRRRMNERMDLVDTQFALQSIEEPELFVAAEEQDELAEAEDDETGIPFTDSMDENIVMIFPTHEEAKQYAEDNDLLDKVTIVTVRINPNESSEEEEEEVVEEEDEMEEACRDMKECGTARMGESLRLRRERARRLAESRATRNSRTTRNARVTRNARYGRR